MSKRLLIMAGCLGVGMAGLALAQDSANVPSKLLVYPKDNTQRAIGPNPHKYIRQPLPSKRKGKLNSLNGSSKPGQNPVKPAPAQGKDQLVDQNGQPVTLWPAGQKKHYSTIYQDK